MTTAQEDAGRSHVLIIHEVEDYERWKAIFDDAATIRRDAGEIAYQLWPTRPMHGAWSTFLAGARWPQRAPSSNLQGWSRSGVSRAFAHRSTSISTKSKQKFSDACGRARLTIKECSDDFACLYRRE